MSSISLASLWASSTGWTLVRKARPKAPSTRPPSFASRLRSMLIWSRRVVLSRGHTRRPVGERGPVRAGRVERDDYDERGGDAARDAATRVVEGEIRGERIAERGVGRDQRRGACSGAKEIHRQPAAADHQREHHRAGRPDQGRRERGRGEERLQRVGRGRRYRALPVIARQDAVGGAEQQDLPVTTSPISTHQRPAAARPARRAPVDASAATPMNAGASAIVPSRGASTGTDHRRPARGRRNGMGAAAAAITSAVPCRSASGETSQAHRPITASNQPTRGSTAVATAASPAAANGEKVGSGPSVSRHASTRPPAAAPAAIRSGTRGWRGTGSSSGDTPASARPSSPRRPPEHHRAALPKRPRRVVVASPTRRRVSGSTRPPSSVSSFSAAFSSARSRAGGGLQRRVRVERVVDRVAQRQRQVAAHRAPARAAAGRGGAPSPRGRPRGPGSCPSTPRTASARASRRRTRASRGRPPPAPAPCRPSVPTMSPVRVSASAVATCATPKSASFANPAPAAGSASTMTFPGFTSRWMTPRACACSSASHRALPMRATSRSEIAPAPRQLRERSAPNQLGDQVDVVVVGRQLVDADDAGVVQPRGGTRLARDPLTLAALARDHLHGDLALQLLVPRQPHDAEPAGAQAALHPVAADDEARPEPSASRCVGSDPPRAGCPPHP